jgi:predicted membrane protein
MAVALPVSVVSALGGALWPVTFVILQVVTNVYFARTGFWRILITGPEHHRPGETAPVPAGEAAWS